MFSSSQFLFSKTVFQTIFHNWIELIFWVWIFIDLKKKTRSKSTALFKMSEKHSIKSQMALYFNRSDEKSKVN